MAARVIAITNQKGGVGKTTSSVNIAEALSRLGKKTLLIDLDPQASASCSLGINRRLTKYSINDVLVNKVNPEEAIIKPQYSQCDMICSNLELSGIDLELVDNPDKMFVLDESLKPLLSKYDYILFDCPPSLGLITLNALYAANSVLIPVQCQFLAMDGLTQLLNTIKVVQKRKRDNHKKLTIEGVLLTMHDKRVNSCWEIATEIKECFGEKVFKTMITTNIKAAEAPMYSKPVIVYAPSSPAAKQYKELAKELVDNNDK